MKTGGWPLKAFVLSALFNCAFLVLLLILILKGVDPIIAYLPIKPVLQEAPSTQTASLFNDLRKNKTRELALSFCQSEEFLLAATLFGRLHPPFSKGEVFALVLSGPFEILETFAASQREGLDLSEAAAKRLLQNYVNQNSKVALSFLARLSQGGS